MFEKLHKICAGPRPHGGPPSFAPTPARAREPKPLAQFSCTQLSGARPNATRAVDATSVRYGQRHRGVVWLIWMVLHP